MGHHVQVIYRKPAMESFYVWIATEDGKINKTDGRDYSTPEKAFDAAVAYLIPGAEPMDKREATPKDFAALNALLYVGGMNEDIETVSDAIAYRGMFVQALEAVREVMVKAPDDLDKGRLIISSTHGPFHEAALNISKISGIFVAQCAVFEQILERSIETIDSFVTGYGQE